MIPWERLGRAQVPGGGELTLTRRGDEFSIRLADASGHGELMNSRLSGSEEALAREALERMNLEPAGRDTPRVLVGGLGMGFTLRAVMQARPKAKVVVAEIVPEIVEWAKGPMAPLFGAELACAELRVADVRDVIVEQAWNAILLDVDNGPDGLSRAGNDALYDLPGLARARTALRPGGVLAVWSSGPDDRFTRRLEKAGFAVDVERVPARTGKRKGAMHVLWFARRS